MQKGNKHLCFPSQVCEACLKRYFAIEIILDENKVRTSNMKDDYSKAMRQKAQQTMMIKAFKLSIIGVRSEGEGLPELFEIPLN